MEKDIETIKNQAEKLLEEIEIKSSVEVSKAEEEGYDVNVDAGDDNALLIGKHGNTLSSFESILALIVAQKTGEFKRLTVEIGNYRAEREEYLKELADRLSKEVMSDGEEKTIRGLKPWERRYIHLHFKESGDVATESIGEDRERTLIIKKK